jgi:phosphatidate cytidylyltransferase
MALNLQTFRTRTISAAIFAVVMLAGLLINHWTFFILFSIIHFGCWIEYQKLVGLIDNNYQKITPFHRYGVMIAGWCIMLYFTTDAYKIFGLRLHEIGWWLGLIFVFVLPIMELLFTLNIQPKLIAHSTFGLIYISLPLGLMIDLSKSIDFYYHDTMFVIAEMSFPIFIIGCLWVNDTMAYIIGSLIGKTQLSKISPKKTWEGTMGGVVLTIAVAGFIAWKFDFPIWLLVIGSGIVAIAAIFGDLLESKLKRMANVKDSGSILPGHGGFLDRFDSLLLAVPFVWLYVTILMHL